MVSGKFFSVCGLLLTLWGVPVSLEEVRPCYDEFKQPQNCYPAFENVAFGKPVDATNTCGSVADVEYCWMNAFGTGPKNCSVCKNHHFPASSITDDDDRTTWWQSETMFEGIHEKTVNLTIHLKKSFDITYLTLNFLSPRPESFAIFKRFGEDGPWVPFQFYSASCRRTYGLMDSRMVRDVKTASCTSRYSDISPLTGGRVSFSSLEGRAWGLDKSTDLLEWVKATDIRVVLTRLNTFGDEALGDPVILKSYFYAISHMSIGARCTCNGHANECKNVQDQANGEKLECVCQHFTTGRDCQQCLPYYNDKPWATGSDGFQCEACDCSGLSEECVFDPQLYDSTGHGGRCINCRKNTAGSHCELCKENYYRVDGNCEDCLCNVAGSTSVQCDETGQCPCQDNVEGVKCNHCAAGYFGTVDTGCRPCDCVLAGSLNNKPECDSTTGQCSCKVNVGGRRCDRCKPSFFDLSEGNPVGCVTCFCHGLSTQCSSAEGFYTLNLTSIFKTGREGWTAVNLNNEPVETQYNGLTQKIGVLAPAGETVYFNAPGRYLGNQRFSYNQFLRFDLNVGNGSAQPTDADVVLEGSNLRVTISITGQSNPTPGVVGKSFACRLHEHPDFQWKPTLKNTDFIQLLSDVTALKIRATYASGGVGFLDNVHLTTASKEFGGEPATWVESCTCPEGYGGLSCQMCSDGYTRGHSAEGNSADCVPCQCQGHSDHCDPDTGRCICKDNTEGDHCEKCASGYYDNASVGTEVNCVPCPCTSGSSCIPGTNGNVLCVDFEEVNKMKDEILTLQQTSKRATEQYELDHTNTNNQIDRLEDKIERLTMNFNKLSSASEDMESDVKTLKRKTKDIIRTFKKVYGIRI